MLYEVLGVEKDATADDIKKAFRKKAVVEHPDKGGDKAKFQSLQNAYSVLSDPQKRAHYDATGQVPTEGPGSGSAPVDISELFGSMFGGGGFSFPSMFGMPGMPGMGMGGPGMQRQSQKVARGPNKLHEIGVSLSDLYHGKTIELQMKRDCLCAACKGKGGMTTTCESCGGSGVRMMQQQMGPMIAMTQAPCSTCQQSGLRVTNACGECRGKKVVEVSVKLEGRINPGMSDGNRIVFPGQCSESPMFHEPGDVILVVRESESPDWVRKGEILACNITISMAESLLGWERTYTNHPSGKTLHVVCSKPVVNGEIVTLFGWGMPTVNSGKGDLQIQCNVMGHSAWTDAERAALMTVWPDWSEPVLQNESVTVHP